MPRLPESKSMHRVVGIIGGMGPEATVDLMRRVLAKTAAHDDQDHIHLIVESNPKIPSRIAHLIEGTGADPTPELIRIAGNLQRAGAEALAWLGRERRPHHAPGLVGLAVHETPASGSIRDLPHGCNGPGTPRGAVATCQEAPWLRTSAGVECEREINDDGACDEAR